MAAAAGVDTSGYTVPYVAHWAGGDLNLLRDTATRVLATARQILIDTGTLPADLVAASPAAWRQPTTVAATSASQQPPGRSP